ncbi:MAG TPA: thermonuclease family protein, partial [Ramlibacter sp.]|nr:thermonuclease family protein [Ramlibacter sp.]
GRDSYRRSLAQVRLSGEDLAGWMVGQGHAWSYRFRSDPGPHTAEERLARQARRGLWASSAPTEPRLFRRRHGRCERD